MKLSRKLQLLEDAVRNDIWQLHQTRLGYAPTAVTCKILKDYSFIISIERLRSSTEQFLLKQSKLQLAQDIGVAINQMLKNEIAEMLKNKLSLPVADCSFLTPTSVESFSVWIAIDSEKMTALSLSEIAEQSERLQPGETTDKQASSDYP